MISRAVRLVSKVTPLRTPSTALASDIDRLEEGQAQYSFLLNEKRTEITKIELKQRVTVLLVPNKHLETPNYKLERLRHDDPRLESYRASYTMIEGPEDEVGITRRRDDVRIAGPKLPTI